MKRFVVDPLRTLVTVLVMAPATAVAAISAIVTAWLSPSSPFIERITRGWSRWWLALTGTKLEVHGDVADRSRSYIVISNHGSWLDIMANFIAVPLPIRFLAKTELFDIPLMGRAMRALGMVEIDRARAASMHEAINAGVRKVAAKGDSVMVYPEGTRTRTGAMQPFKRGAFFMAVDNQLPILPVTISGSYPAWPPGPIARGGTLTVEIGEPIETEGMTRDDVARLLERCESLIRETRAKLDGDIATGHGST